MSIDMAGISIPTGLLSGREERYGLMLMQDSRYLPNAVSQATTPGRSAMALMKSRAKIGSDCTPHLM